MSAARAPLASRLVSLAAALAAAALAAAALAPSAAEGARLPLAGEPAPAAPPVPHLTSAYVELRNGRCAALDASGWERELDALAAVGVRAVVAKNVVRNPHRTPGEYDASYPSRLPWVTARAPVDAVEALLAAADSRNFSVSLGHLEDHVFFNKALRSPEYLSQLAARCVQVQGEISELYGHHASLVGSYDPQEVNAMSFAAAAEREALVARYLSPVWGAARGRGLATSAAPFFSPNTSDPSTHAAWWDAALAALPEGSLSTAFLDDDLATNFYTVEGPLPFFAAAAKVLRARGVAVWSDAVDHTHENEPCDAARLVKQLQLEAPLLDGPGAFTTFEWCYYFSPMSGERQKALYDGYAAYLRSATGGGARAGAVHRAAPRG